jgi:hypothetical protein
MGERGESGLEKKQQKWPSGKGNKGIKATANVKIGRGKKEIWPGNRAMDGMEEATIT